MTAGGWVAVAFLAEFAAAAVVFRGLRRRAGGLPAPGDGHHPARVSPFPPVPGNNPVPGTTTPQVTPRPPARPSPAPGPWHTSPCGEPPDILTCPRHASRREDILHLLQWAEELKDRL